MQSNVQVESWHYQYRIVTTTRYSLLRFSFRKFDTLIHKSKQNSMDATLKTPLCLYALLSLRQEMSNVLPTFFKKGQSRPLLSFIFGLFKQTSFQFLQQIYVKNVHPVGTH